MWSKHEKAVARKAFHKAYERETVNIVNEVKKMANSIKTPENMWELHDFLTKKRNEIDYKYDYRFSHLIFVFGRLLREGWLKEADLQGLAEDKITQIKKFLLLK